MSSTLLLHCGGQKATMADLAAIPTPPPEGIWHPVPHVDVVNMVEQAYADAGYELTGRSLGTNHGGAQLFGVSTFKPLGQFNVPKALQADVAVGYRSSLDKSLSLDFVGGGRVFICDNLALNGAIRKVRKHTTHVVRDAQTLLLELVNATAVNHAELAKDFSALHDADLDDAAAFRLVGEAWGKGYLNGRQAAKALNEWKAPSHEEWRERKNVWRWYAGATEALKTSHSRRAMASYTAVHRLAVQQVRTAA